MQSIEPPTWGPPAQYLYLLQLDEVSLAWEYLRRNRHYCRDFCRAMRDGEQPMQPHSWGLLHWEDPREDARFLEPHWASRPKTQITLAPGHLEQKARSFDFWKIPGRKSLRHDGEHVSLTMRCGSEVLQRVRWVENLNQG